jgi:hypothetical protein
MVDSFHMSFNLQRVVQREPLTMKMGRAYSKALPTSLF